MGQDDCAEAVRRNVHTPCRWLSSAYAKYNRVFPQVNSMPVGEKGERAVIDAYRRSIYSTELSDALSKLPAVLDRDCDNDIVAISFDVRFHPEENSFSSFYTGHLWKYEADHLWLGYIDGVANKKRQDIYEIEQALRDDRDALMSLNEIVQAHWELGMQSTMIRAFCTHVGIAWNVIEWVEDIGDWPTFEYGALINPLKNPSDAFCLAELTRIVGGIQRLNAYWDLNGLREGDPSIPEIVRLAKRRLELYLC
jgi:hypothetical protein